MRRLLALDGGGIRGIVALEVLQRIEALARERHGAGRTDFVLADYFDFIGGTSTGAIIAALLAWGLPVARVRELYRELGPRIFRRRALWNAWRTKFHATGLTDFLRTTFREDSGSDARLGSPRLRTGLLVVLRNGSTGSVWPLTNHPATKFNRVREGRVSNLDLPLWQVIRASAAAPTFFPTETIVVHDRDGRPHNFEFIDGGVSAYNNPAFLLFCVTTLPEYGIGWPVGVDELRLFSVGTGRIEETYQTGELGRINRIGGALRVLRALGDGVAEQQDVLCRLAGRCELGSEIDAELGALLHRETGLAGGPPAFRYFRYNHTFTSDELEAARRLMRTRSPFSLDAVAAVPLLESIGRDYAARAVRREHFGAPES
jgi:hypothetical protein